MKLQKLKLADIEPYKNNPRKNDDADPQGVPDTPDEWLDQFGTFSIYQVLPEIIELWGLNVQTQVESKKTSSD